MAKMINDFPLEMQNALKIVSIKFQTYFLKYFSKFNLISDSFTCCDNLSGSCKLSCENVSIIYGSTKQTQETNFNC